MEIKKAVNVQISEASEVYKLFNQFSEEKQELFLVVSLNTKNKIINTHISSIGTLDSSTIHPRDIFREAIRNNASGIILIHNHPSGDVNPSNEDLKVTKLLKNISNIIGIKLLDHLIISKDQFFSFQESGLL
jgi:DNA repair protein RadC